MSTRTIVVSQPMFFPWLGLLEQVRLADVFVHYDDVQYVRRAFGNRVQLKTASGARWLTVPLADQKRGQSFRETRIDESKDWRQQHRGQLAAAYRNAPHFDDMMELVEYVYSRRFANLAELSIASLLAMCRYLGVGDDTEFHRASDLHVPGRSSQRLVDIVRSLHGTHYVTGHGARNYLDHELFERHGIQVEYMNYRKLPYRQQHGDFTPFVSSLDLIANLGRGGAAYINSDTVCWKSFLGSNNGNAAA